MLAGFRHFHGVGANCVVHMRNNVYFMFFEHFDICVGIADNVFFAGLPDCGIPKIRQRKRKSLSEILGISSLVEAAHNNVKKFFFALFKIYIAIA